MEQGIVFMQVEYKVQTHPFDWSILFFEYFVKFPQQTNNYASQFYIKPSLNNLSLSKRKSGGETFNYRLGPRLFDLTQIMT